MAAIVAIMLFSGIFILVSFDKSLSYIDSFLSLRIVFLLQN